MNLVCTASKKVNHERLLSRTKLKEELIVALHKNLRQVYAQLISIPLGIEHKEDFELMELDRITTERLEKYKFYKYFLDAEQKIFYRWQKLKRTMGF